MGPPVQAALFDSAGIFVDSLSPRVLILVDSFQDGQVSHTRP